jgi:hypothetical protein
VINTIRTLCGGAQSKMHITGFLSSPFPIKRTVQPTELGLVHAGIERVPTDDGKRINRVLVLQQKTGAIAYGRLHESRIPRKYKDHGDTNIKIMNMSLVNEIKILETDYSNKINYKYIKT